MKIVINQCYGGYDLNDKYEKKANRLGVNCSSDTMRTDPELIAEIESGTYKNAFCSSLGVVEIPDNTTDYEITEYDGLENIIYVVDGKIHWA